MNPQLREPGDDLRELYFSRGDGVNDERMTFKGTLKAINAALKHLSYVGGADFNGDDTITIQANDMGQYKSSTPSQPGLDTLDILIKVIAVNDKPVITVPMQDSHNKMYRFMKIANSGSAG